MDNLWAYGLILISVVTLAWCIYHAGRADEKTKQSTEKLEDVLFRMEKERKRQAESSRLAGQAADIVRQHPVAPVHPDGLSDAARARILKP